MHTVELFIRNGVALFEVINHRVINVITAGCVTRFPFGKGGKTIATISKETLSSNVVNRRIFNRFAIQSQCDYPLTNRFAAVVLHFQAFRYL